MATSERILTTPPRTTGVRRRSAASPQWIVWRQACLDFGTVLLTLVAGQVLSSPEWWRWLQPTVAIAAMISTILAFAGAYPSYRTPLDIASTKGFVKAASCIAALLALYGIGWHMDASRRQFVVGMFLAIFLLLQREVMHGLLGRSGSSCLLQPNTPQAISIGYRLTNESPLVERRAGFALKRIVDVTGAVVMLLLCLPLGLAVAALIKLDSPGPVFLRQRRIGRCGTSFYMWKFRSMYVGAPRYARSPISDSDPRLTRLGRALRRLSLDELPQLLNVLKGDMSLVGPRPEMPFIVKEYTAYERLRLNAIPGITGLWQISPARAMPIHHNLELDLYYIEHQSFFLDTAIMLRTVTAVVRGIGAL